MLKRFYLDTCIWRDYFEDRKDRFRPLGEWAHRLIRRIVDNGHIFVVSRPVINELRKFYSDDEMARLFSIIPKILMIRIVENEEQSKKASILKRRFDIPFGDALHAVMARDNDAVLVSRDMHFYLLQEYVTVRKPEDLI